MDGFVIDDVTTTTRHSRRTFANHFSCKEEAVAEVVVIDAIQVLEGLRIQPGGSAIDALELAVRSQLNEGTIDRIASLQALARDHPALRPYMLATYSKLMRPLLNILSGARGEAHADLDTLLLANSCYGMLNAITMGEIDFQLTDDEQPADSAPARDELIGLVFTRLRSGFAPVL